MTSFKPSRKSIRYVKARFKPFTRPLFWSSLIILGLVGAAIYQYWQHPELLESNSETSIDISKQNNFDPRSSFSSDELGVGADIDNLQLLFTELDKQQILTPATSLKANTDDNGKQVDRDSSNRFKERQKTASQLPKVNINRQDSGSQTNVYKEDLLLENANLRGSSALAQNSNDLPRSNSPFQNNFVGGLYRRDSNFNRQKNLTSNFNSSFTPANIQPNNLTENSTSSDNNIEQIPQTQTNLGMRTLNNNRNNYSSQQPIAPISPTGFFQNSTQVNGAYPNYSQGISNNSAQIAPLNNPYQYNGTQYQTQSMVNNTYNPDRYSAGNYGASALNGANISNYQTNSNNPYSLNNYQNYQAQPNLQNQPDFNNSRLRTSSLNQVDFNR
jgi:hypothetical protein